MAYPSTSSNKYPTGVQPVASDGDSKQRHPVDENPAGYDATVKDCVCKLVVLDKAQICMDGDGRDEDARC